MVGESGVPELALQSLCREVEPCVHGVAIKILRTLLVKALFFHLLLGQLVKVGLGSALEFDEEVV